MLSNCSQSTNSFPATTTEGRDQEAETRAEISVSLATSHAWETADAQGTFTQRTDSFTQDCSQFHHDFFRCFKGNNPKNLVIFYSCII